MFSAVDRSMRVSVSSSLGPATLIVVSRTFLPGTGGFFRFHWFWL